MRKVIGLLVLGLLTACSTTTTTTAVNAPPADDVGRIIMANDEAFAAAMNRMDMATVMSYYAFDAEVLPPNAPIVRGKAAIQQFWTGLLSAAPSKVAIRMDHVMTSGLLATEVGHYDLTISPPGAPAIHDTGKFSVTWRKEGSDWKIVVDMFSSDNPPKS